MDLISREKALADDGLAEFHRYDDYSKMRNYLKSLPSAFEGMTYGEIIKAVFEIEDDQIDEAKYIISVCPKGSHHDPFIAVKREVWNSPYKGGK